MCVCHHALYSTCVAFNGHHNLVRWTLDRPFCSEEEETEARQGQETSQGSHSKWRGSLNPGPRAPEPPRDPSRTGPRPPEAVPAAIRPVVVTPSLTPLCDLPPPTGASLLTKDNFLNGTCFLEKITQTDGYAMGPAPCRPHTDRDKFHSALSPHTSGSPTLARSTGRSLCRNPHAWGGTQVFIRSLQR